MIEFFAQIGLAAIVFSAIFFAVLMLIALGGVLIGLVGAAILLLFAAIVGIFQGIGKSVWYLMSRFYRWVDPESYRAAEQRAIDEKRSERRAALYDDDAYLEANYDHVDDNR